MYQQQFQPYPNPYPYPQVPAKVSPGVLAGVSIWRLVIVASAFTGFFAAMSRGKFENLIPALSQQASLLTGIVYIGLLLYPAFTAGRRHEPRSPWWRGAMVILLVLVCVTYIAIIGGSLEPVWSMFEHLITPLLVLVDFLAVGRNQAAVKWWHPMTWLAFPLAYLVYYLAEGLRMYGSFLNPDKDMFPGVIAGFIAALLALGYLLYAFGKIKRSAVRPAQPPHHQPPHHQPQYPVQQPYPVQQQPVPPPGYYPNR